MCKCCFWHYTKFVKKEEKKLHIIKKRMGWGWLVEKCKWRWQKTFVWWKLLKWVSKNESAHAWNFCDDWFDYNNSVREGFQKKTIESVTTFHFGLPPPPFVTELGEIFVGVFFSVMNIWQTMTHILVLVWAFLRPSCLSPFPCASYWGTGDGTAGL